MAFNHPFRLAAAACLGLASAAVAAEPPLLRPAAIAASSDQQLADAVVRKLADTPGLAGYHVEISCLNGAVELEGKIKDAHRGARPHGAPESAPEGAS